MNENRSTVNHPTPERHNIVSRVESLRREIRAFDTKRKAFVIVRNVMGVMLLAGAVAMFSPWHIFGFAVLVGLVLPAFEFDRLASSYRDQSDVRERRANELQSRDNNNNSTID